MGISESSLQNCNDSLKNCITDVLGSFDCTCKSKFCENYKCLNWYYHCRTTQNDILTESECEENDVINDK